MLAYVQQILVLHGMTTPYQITWLFVFLGFLGDEESVALKEAVLTGRNQLLNGKL